MPFLEFCRDRCIDPALLADSISSFGRFVRSNSEAMEDQRMMAAAAVFAGNVLTKSRDDAHWFSYEGHFPSAGTSARHYEMLEVIRLMTTADEDRFEQFLGILEG